MAPAIAIMLTAIVILEMEIQRSVVMESAVRATAVIGATVTAMVDTDAPEVEEALESLQETTPLDARLPLNHTAQRMEVMASA